MGSHPLNLALRFVLELGALFAFGLWGYRSLDGPLRYVIALAVPLAAASAWGLFAVPNDPSRSGHAPVPVPGVVRLTLELAFFALAVWCLHRAGHARAALALAAFTAAHYVVSYDRVAWLWRV